MTTPSANDNKEIQKKYKRDMMYNRAELKNPIGNNKQPFAEIKQSFNARHTTQSSVQSLSALMQAVIKLFVLMEK